jgi:hypothetical protein
MWPATFVQRLVPHLPDDSTAEPRAHLGTYYEIDICTFEDEEPTQPGFTSADESRGVATATWAPPQPTLTVETDLGEEYVYEVLVYDQSRARHLVAAVEIVSPANKDREESRRAFVTKCAALLQQGVCVSIVDLVTTRHFNLYTELLSQLHRSDPAFGPRPPWLYAVTCRKRKNDRTSHIDSWAYPLAIGQPLPTLPLWLSEELFVPVELEASYEDTCRALRIA